MSDESRAIVPVCQHGIVASVGRRLEITEKLLAGSLVKKEYICPITGAKFVFIPAGTFMMGSIEDEIECGDVLHQVTISEPFYLQTTPVTQRQWEMVMGNNPSYFKGENRPVERVSWDDVQEYTQKLNELVGDVRYRLPTEAEWEYAARSGGTAEKWAGTSNESSLGDYAWLLSNSGEEITHPVGQKRPNSFGIYDMTGNVWEWCQDWYGVSQRGGPVPNISVMRVLRGGSSINSAQDSRAAYRNGFHQDNRNNYSVGFRVAVGHESLTDIQAELNNCQRCLLCKDRTNLVFGAGTTNARLVFVGEAPGIEEDRQGKPFVGKAGQILTRIIEAMGFKREEVYLCNVIKCRPLLNRVPLRTEIDQCLPFLLRQIKAIQPDMIVALGTTAAQTLTKSNEPFLKLRGNFYYYHGIHLMPTFHPAYLLRDPSRKQDVWDDVRQVSQLLGKIPFSEPVEPIIIVRDIHGLNGRNVSALEEPLNKEKMIMTRAETITLKMLNKVTGEVRCLVPHYQGRINMTKSNFSPFTCDACKIMVMHDPSNGHVPVGWSIRIIEEKPYILCESHGADAHFYPTLSSSLRALFAVQGIYFKEGI